MYFNVFLSLSPSLAADNQGAWVGFISCLAARNLVLNFPSFCRVFDREDLLNLYVNSPGCDFQTTLRAAYKQPLYCYTSSLHSQQHVGHQALRCSPAKLAV